MIHEKRRILPECKIFQLTRQAMWCHIFIISVVLISATSQRKVSIIVDRIEYSSNTNYMKYTGGLNENGKVDLLIECFQPISNIHLALEVTALKFIGNQDVLLMNRTISYCRKRSKNEVREKLWLLIMDSVRQFSNMSRGCPFKPGAYFVRNYQLDSIDMPNFIPDSRFKVKFTLYTENIVGDLEWVGGNLCYGSIRDVTKSKNKPEKLPKPLFEFKNNKDKS